MKTRTHGRDCADGRLGFRVSQRITEGAGVAAVPTGAEGEQLSFQEPRGSRFKPIVYADYRLSDVSHIGSPVR